jgi:hypothetical protein
MPFQRAEWLLGKGHCDFLASLADKALAHWAAIADNETSTLGLLVDEDFLDSLSLLDGEDADQVLDAVKVASISEATFVYHEITAERCARFRRLCNALASIDTIKDVYIMHHRENFTTYTYGYAIQVLKQLHSLTITSFVHDPRMMADLSTALQGHPTLQKLSIYAYGGNGGACLLFPASIGSIPGLTKVSFHTDPSHLTTASTQRIVNLLRIDAPILVDIHCLDFADMSAYTLFCTGLAQATVRSVGLRGFFKVSDGALLADALTSSTLRAISCSPLGFREQREATLFLKTFATELPTMRCLEELHVGTIEHFGHDIDEHSELDAALIRATADCPCLKRLKIDLYRFSCGYTEALDRALAHCVQASTSLEEIDVKRQCEANWNEFLTCPALLDALKRNYTIQYIRLTSDPYPGSQSSWATASTTIINIMCRLNRSGRNYMAIDSNNHLQGLQVLDAVNDDLDCLYFHLRENPMLCEQSIGLATLFALVQFPFDQGRRAIPSVGL